MKRRIACFAVLLMVITALPCSMTFAKTTPKIRKRLVISVGQEKKIKVKNTGKPAKWKSSNKKVATVSKKGVVTGKKRGTVTITAKMADKKLKCKVFVGKPIYSDKYVKLYYISHNDRQIKFAAKNKRKCTAGVQIDGTGLDGQHFPGFGGVSLKAGEHKAFYLKIKGKRTLNKKPHKKLSLIGVVFDEKDGDEDQIVKVFEVKDAVIGKQENYTGFNHTDKIALDNSEVKISYAKRGDDSYVFYVTNKSGTSWLDADVTEFSINGTKCSSVVSWAPGTSALSLMSGHTGVVYVLPEPMGTKEKKLEGVMKPFQADGKEKKYRFSVSLYNHLI